MADFDPATFTSDTARQLLGAPTKEARPVQAVASAAAPSVSSSDFDPSTFTSDTARQLLGRSRTEPDAAPVDDGQEGQIKNVPWSDVPGTALKNVLPSGRRLVEQTANAVMHPIKTGEGVGALAAGAAHNVIGTPASDESVEAANSVGKFYKDRYGSLQGFKDALANDPVGVLSDLSIPFTGGEMALGKAADVAGKAGAVGKALDAAGKVSGKIATAVDPFTLPALGVKQATKAVGAAVDLPLWMASGGSRASLSEALKAGMGDSPGFFQTYHGAVDGAGVVKRVQKAVTTYRDNFRKNWLSDKNNLAKAQTDMSGTLLDAYNELSNIAGAAYHYGVVSPSNVKNAEAAAAFNAVQDKLNHFVDMTVNDPANKIGQTSRWSSLLGMDELKQGLYNIWGQYKDPTAKAIATNVAQFIKSRMENIDPGYTKLMDDYQMAQSNLVNMADLASQKQPVARSVTKLIKSMDKPGARETLRQLNDIDPEIVPMLAGLELHEATPHGLRGHLASVLSTMGAIALHPGFLAGAAASSPKAAGLVKLGLGAIGGAPARATHGTPAAIRRLVHLSQQGRQPYRSGGAVHITKADQLLKATEDAKKELSASTEPLLSTPDETVARALSVANQHI